MTAEDERKALATLIETSRTPMGGVLLGSREQFESIADHILAAGYRRQGPTTDAQADAANQAWHEYVWGPEEPLSNRDLRITRQAWKVALEAARDA